MKRGYIFFCLLISSKLLCAQTEQLLNHVYLEAGGNGIFGSVNYERQLVGIPGLGWRLGVGFYSQGEFHLSVPVGINYLFPLGKPHTFIDVGLGLTWARINKKLFGDPGETADEYFVSFIPGLGYRWYTLGEFMWRVNVTPVINKYGLAPWLGFSIGKRF